MRAMGEGLVAAAAGLVELSEELDVVEAQAWIAGLKRPMAKFTKWKRSAKSRPTAVLPMAPTIWLATIAGDQPRRSGRP